MASGAIGGTAFLKVDGVQYAMRGNWKVTATDTVRKGVAGMDGVHGWTQAFQVPSAEGDVSDSGGLSVQALQSIVSSTVTLELVNGKTYVLVSAWYAGDGSLDVVQGQTTVKFECVSVNEILATGN